MCLQKVNVIYNQNKHKFELEKEYGRTKYEAIKKLMKKISI